MSAKPAVRKPIDPQHLVAAQGKGENVVLLDVREHEEVAICHIPGAVHIPMADVPARMAELDAAARVVVYCHRGVPPAMTRASS